MGETKMTLKVRLSEHSLAVKRGDPMNGIAVHVQKTNHCINWEGATVQRRAKGFWLRGACRNSLWLKVPQSKYDT